MKNKSLKIPAIIIAIGLVLCVAAYLLTGIVKMPVITEHDFHYSATYKLDGETKTIEGIYRVKFKFTGTGIDPLERYYEGCYPSGSATGEPEFHTLSQKDDLELRVVFIFADDYLMGDADPGEEYSDAIPEPYLAVYDAEGCEYSELEMLEKFDAELISWETPQPIENTFVFSGFSRLHDGSMLSMLLVSVLVVVACVIFVKKDEGVTYQSLDKACVVLNFLVGLIAVPFITLVAGLMGIYCSGEEILYQINRCVPAIAVFGIAASLSLRRKGFRRTGFLIQFIGPVLFVILANLESVI